LPKNQLSNLKAGIHKRDQNYDSLKRNAPKYLSKEDLVLFEKFDNFMTINGSSMSFRYNELSMFVNMRKRVDWNWVDIDENKLSRLLIDIMQQHGDNGKETAYTYSQKLTIRKIIRFILTGNTHKDQDNPEPSILKLFRSMKRPKPKLTREQLPTNEEVKKLLNTCADSPRDKAMFSLQLDAGIRAGELLNLRIGNFRTDANGGWIEVDGKTGVRPIRIVKCVPDLVKWINTHPFREQKDYPLWIYLHDSNHFGKPMNYSGFNYILKKRCRMAEIDKRIYSHLFRHKEATDLAGKLTESESRLRHGWTRSSNMPSLYTHLNQDDLDQKMLEIYGIKSPKVEIPETNKCPYCNIEYPSDIFFCDMCSRPIDVATANEMEKQSREMQEALILEVIRKEKASQRKRKSEEGTQQVVKKQQEEIELLKQTIKSLSK